jgi:hypothetical protein
MRTDIRLPIGLLFFIVGVIITIFGFSTKGAEMYTQHSLGINVNIYSGFCLMIFGGFMLISALIAQGKQKTNVPKR